MVDVFPRRNLPPLAEQWGREVENRVVSSEGSIESLQQSLSGQNRNTASSLSVLARQVSDLLGRVSHSLSSSDSQSWTSSQPNNQPWGPVLDFTLTEARTVSVTFMVEGQARISALGGVASGSSRIAPTLFVNGSRVGPTQPGVIVDLPGTTGASTDISAPLQARALLTLPAGLHSLQGGFQFRTVTATSGTAVGLTASRGPQLYVDVLQPSA